jgi:hypothetical protein
MSFKLCTAYMCPKKLPHVVALRYLPDNNNNKDAICVVVLCLLCGEERRGSISFYRAFAS